MEKSARAKVFEERKWGWPYLRRTHFTMAGEVGQIELLYKCESFGKEGNFSLAHSQRCRIDNKDIFLLLVAHKIAGIEG